MNNNFMMGATVILAALMINSRVHAQEVENGMNLFNKICLSCHYNPNEDKTWFGPSLHGVVNRPSASYPNFSYSSAMKRLNIVWTVEQLDRFLKSPDVTVPGTTMDCIGIKSEKDRADIIAYLKADSQ